MENWDHESENGDPPFDDPFQEGHADADAPVRIRSTTLDPERHPDLHRSQSTVLKDGPRARKEAVYIEIVNRNTGEFHHASLTIKTSRQRRGTWSDDARNTITLTSEGEDEIRKLLDFLQAVHSGSVPRGSTDYLLRMPAEGITAEALQEVARHLSAPDKAKVLADILEVSARDSGLLQMLIERAARHPQLFADAAAALNLATYRRTLADLRQLIEADAKEAQFQSLLQDNPWMFGSEYSKLLDRRRWTRDEQQDFVVRRTTDGYVELIEIKTPLGGSDLFGYDRSHDSYYAAADLSKVVGQVQKYLERLDAERNSILANDGEDTCKIRAKIVIGRDGDDTQRQALRRFNGHLHRIEVLTFDQLVRIAERVVGYLEGILKAPGEGLAGID